MGGIGMKKEKNNKQIFTVVFVCILIVISIIFASGYRADVLVPSDSTELDDLEINLENYKVEFDTFDEIVEEEYIKNAVYPEYRRVFKLIDENDKTLYLYVWKMETESLAKDAWNKIWMIEASFLPEIKGSIKKMNYSYGKMVPIGKYFEVLLWQKGRWVIFAKTIDYLIPEKTEVDFLKSFFNNEIS